MPTPDPSPATRPGIAVFSRTDSSRLPGKALADMAGAPMVARVVERLQRCRAAGPVVVATSDRALDDALARTAEGLGVAVFRGSVDDVAGRALACCHTFGWPALVRISGDSPFIPPELVDRMAALWEPGIDLLTNVAPRTFPPGASVEVIDAAALERAVAAMDEPDDREHVTRFFYRRPDAFTIRNLAAEDPAAYAGIALTVDTPDDLERSRWMIDQLGADPAAATLDAVVALARRYTPATP